MRPAGPPAIVVEDLRKSFGRLEAVAGVSFEVAEGTIFGLLGPNGAGKSTTLKMLVTILRPTSGRAEVAGIDVTRHPSKVRQNVGIVFQEPSLDSILTARENLELHGRLYGVPRARLRERVDEMLRLVDLEKRQHDLVKTYSGGMKRRLELARGLLHQPKVVFLDEPTLGLDPATREHIWDYIRDLRDKQGTTVVLTTHYMEEADKLCDRIAVIDHGRIVALDTPRGLKAGLGGDLVMLDAPRADRKALEALPFVVKAEERDGQLALTVRDAAANLGRLLALAGEVRSVEVRPTRLEDVFLALTGRGIRDEGEEEGGWMSDYMRYQQTGDNR